MKVREKNVNPGPRNTHWTTDRPRPKGEVRIEKLEDVEHHAPPLDAEDADFEEIKD